MSEGPINVIEVRKAKNGYVVSAFMDRGRYMADSANACGYATYVVQSEDPVDIGKAVEQALRDYAITSDVVIPPSRPVP